MYASIGSYWMIYANVNEHISRLIETTIDKLKLVEANTDWYTPIYIYIYIVTGQLNNIDY
jgi:hypothetical protein